jgi:hypothetical protein
MGAAQASILTPADGLASDTEALSLARDIRAPQDEAGALEGIGRCHMQAADSEAGATSCGKP